MAEWFCRKCDSRAVTQSSDPRSVTMENGIIYHHVGQLCHTCTEKENSPVIMWPLPKHEQSK